MLDMFHMSPQVSDQQIFYGTQAATGVGWQVWNKPRGKKMAHILLVGCGGNGGTGAIGANSTAAGGGGGGSGSQTSMICPIYALPDILFLSLPGAGVGGAAVSYVQTKPGTEVQHSVIRASGGGNGGNGSGATAGAAGAAGAAASAAAMCAGSGIGTYTTLGGQAGIIAGTNVAGGNLTIPTTGLIVTGGTGGGGLPAAAATGTNAGGFTVPAAPSYFPPHLGGQGSATATNPAASGNPGFMNLFGVLYSFGGTGGASTHGTATGAGLQQSSGGNGGPGAGGGGMGGALTGSAAGQTGKGGASFCIITCW
jgi:hypothetical protein